MDNKETKVTSKEILGLSDDMVEGIYGQAYQLYQTGKYKDAAQLFQLLIMVNSTEPKFHLSLAACLHMMKDYASAADAYAICSALDSDNPLPHYHASDCYLQLNDPYSALAALELTMERAGSKPQFQIIKDRSKLTAETLKKTLKERENV